MVLALKHTQFILEWIFKYKCYTQPSDFMNKCAVNCNYCNNLGGINKKKYRLKKKTQNFFVFIGHAIM